MEVRERGVNTVPPRLSSSMHQLREVHAVVLDQHLARSLKLRRDYSGSQPSWAH